MASPHRQYTEELYKRFSYIAAWLPGVNIRLGDVGFLGKGGFEYVTNLKNLDIPYQVRKDKTSINLSYQSEGSVALSFGASGDIPTNTPVVKSSADVTVEMSRANAILFRAANAYSPYIENQYEVGQIILDRFRQNNWDKDHWVVTEVLEAESGTILISNAPGAKVVLKAEGDIETGDIALANADAHFRIELSKNMHTTIVTNEGLTPLIKVRRVKTKFMGLGGAVFRGDSPEFVEALIDELEFEE